MLKNIEILCFNLHPLNRILASGAVLRELAVGGPGCQPPLRRPQPPDRAPPLPQHLPRQLPHHRPRYAPPPGGCDPPGSFRGFLSDRSFHPRRRQGVPRGGPSPCASMLTPPHYDAGGVLSSSIQTQFPKFFFHLIRYG